MRAGESFRFRVEAQDAHGCRVQLAASWRVSAGAELGKVDQTGLLRIGSAAPSGQVTLEMVGLGQRVEVVARVVSAAEYERLLAGGGYEAGGESLEPASMPVSNVVAIEQDQEFDADGHRRWLGVGLGATALLLGVALWVGLRRVRTALSEPPSPVRNTSSLASPSATPVQEAPTPAEAVQAPTQTSATSSSDGRLEPGQVAPALTKVCPVCARTYMQDTTFCGEDGARLVRLN